MTTNSQLAYTAMLDNLQAISNQADVVLNQDTLRSFMRQLFALGCAVTIDQARRDSPDMQQFLRVSAPLLVSALPAIDSYIFRFKQQLAGSWEGSWPDACESRSALAFLFSVYRPTLFGPYLPLIEREELDDIVWFRARRDGYVAPEAVPPGVPKSHWWWFPELWQGEDPLPAPEDTP